MEKLVHDKSYLREKIAGHCRKGSVLGTSFQHYRAWTMWMKKSKVTRISGKFFHKQKYLTNLGVTPEDRVIAAMGKLSQELGGKKTNHISETKLDQLTSLGEILKKRIEDEEEQDRSARQSNNQTILQSTQHKFSNRNFPIATKPYPRFPDTTPTTSKPRTAPDITPAARFPRVSPLQQTPSPTAISPPTTPPRVQPQRRSPRLAEQASERAVDIEIQ